MLWKRIWMAFVFKEKKVYLKYCIYALEKKLQLRKSDVNRKSSANIILQRKINFDRSYKLNEKKKKTNPKSPDTP